MRTVNFPFTPVEVFTARIGLPEAQYAAAESTAPVLRSVVAAVGEMGVRMALGAEARDVLRLIMKQGLLQLAIGLGLGLALAVAVSSLLQMLLLEVNPRDPIVFAVIGALLTTPATLACLVPATRATRVQPVQALRYD